MAFSDLLLTTSDLAAVSRSLSHQSKRMVSGLAPQPVDTTIDTTSTSFPSHSIPQAASMRKMSLAESSVPSLDSRHTTFSIGDDASDTDPSTPVTESSEEAVDDLPDCQHSSSPQSHKARRASTILVSEDTPDSRLFLGQNDQATTQMFQKVCCGGGCCQLKEMTASLNKDINNAIVQPTNGAYASLNVRLGILGIDTDLTDLAEPPEQTVTFEPLDIQPSREQSRHDKHPPNFVKPHPPYDVYSAPLFHARELTKPGAEKRTYHFDIDVTDYPAESGDVDFVVGGAIGVCAPNDPITVEKVFDRLGIPRQLRDKPLLLKTTKGRWPTIWGEDEPRELITTRRELLTWCTDIQSYPPTKTLFRLFADHATDPHERQILRYLASAQGQASFCDLRTGPHLTLLQLLESFPSSQPPLDHLLSCLNQLMPRFYSLSQDPQFAFERDASDPNSPKHARRIIEVAVSVHEAPHYLGGKRTGVGSGFLERLAHQFIEAEKAGIDPRSLDLRIPMFRGLMANPLAREFVTDGPMLLIGAGVGIAPFRGFVHRRLKNANCANKVWVLQGIRDSLVDELYAGDWGVHEDKVKKVVQSRKAEGKYVQDEVRRQADLVWFVINALDGRVFVCGSSKGMGEGVEKALVDVAMEKGNLNEEAARSFWDEKKAAGQYIAETW